MPQEMKRCPYCDERIRKNAIKCRYCGSMLNQPASAPPGATAKAEELVAWIHNALGARYEIVKELGRGGMSVVFLAKQKNLNRHVALKVLPPQMTHDKEFLQRFHREAQAAAKLNHPNVVTVYDEGIDSGVHYIAMEYIDGTDLHQHIRNKGALPNATVKSLLLPVIDGVGHAHQQGLIHRDIKSSNILIDKNGRAVLTDFGIAHAAESTGITQAGMVVGTPEFMSPEQSRGERLDARSDIYSLGVVLYHALTGVLPFHAGNIMATLHKVAHVAPTPPRGIRPNIPQQLENAVLRCLAKNAAERYKNCAELKTALLKGETRPSAAGQKPSAAKTQKPGRRPKAAGTKKAAPQPGPTIMENAASRQYQKRQPAGTGAFGAPVWLKVSIGAVSAALVLMVILLLVLLPGREEPVHSRRTKASDPSSSRQDTAVTQGKRGGSQSAEEINRLLQQAQNHIDANRLTTPADRNALENIEAVLALQPQHDDALLLKQKIAQTYRSWGEAAMERKEYNKAMNSFKKALQIDPALTRVNAGLAEAKQRRRFLSDLDIEMVYVKGDAFQMGSNAEEADGDEQPVHEVYVDDFDIAKTQVTNQQYCAFLNNTGVSSDGSLSGEEYIDMDDSDCQIDYHNGRFVVENGKADRPVIEVTWYGAVAFCDWLSEKTGDSFRLPTEAEWEYAARGGQKSRGYKYSGGNDLDAVGWYADNSGGRTHDVAQMRSNELGLYDMSGNVWEWCYDWYDSDYYEISPRNNPQGPSGNSRRVKRGGSWRYDARDCRVAYRGSSSPGNSRYDLGFRPVQDKN